MRNLTDIHHQLSSADQVYLEKQAEQYKIAEEEDAAGRIMARGFADELQKLASPRSMTYLPGQNPPPSFGNQSSFSPEKPGIIPMKGGYDTSSARKSGEGGAARFGMGTAPGTSVVRNGAVPQVNGVVRAPRPASLAGVARR